MINDFVVPGKDKADLEAAGEEARSSEIRVGSKPDDRLDFDQSEDDEQVKNVKEEQKYQEKQYRQQLRSKGSKSLAVKSNSLDFLGGDVTLTDRYGMIRGTFMQRNDSGAEQRHFVEGEFTNEWQVNVVGSNRDKDQWELVQSAETASQGPPASDRPSDASSTLSTP